MINGLGGAFIFSHRPANLAAWYTEHLGFSFEGSTEAATFYQMFWTLDPDDPERRRDTTFAIMQAEAPTARSVPDEEPESMYGDQPFMVNLRTDDLDALVAHLETKGVSILKRQDEPYGRFAWIRDPDGHRIELYQPLTPPS